MTIRNTQVKISEQVDVDRNVEECVHTHNVTCVEILLLKYLWMAIDGLRFCVFFFISIAT